MGGFIKLKTTRKDVSCLHKGGAVPFPGVGAAVKLTPYGKNSPRLKELGSAPMSLVNSYYVSDPGEIFLILMMLYGLVEQLQKVIIPAPAVPAAWSRGRGF